MFQIKLLVLVTLNSCSFWSVVWIGDNLRQLFKSALNYFTSFFGRDNLSLSSEYVYDSDEFCGYLNLTLNGFNDFFKLPVEVQRGFVSQFKLVLDSAINCGNYVNVFNDVMTFDQFETLSEIVKKYEDKNNG